MAEQGRAVVAVVNPMSQGGLLGRCWPKLAKVLADEIGPFEHLLTTGPGQAPRLARQALEAGADLVISVGGDGTLSEVANGFFDEAGHAVRPTATLGMLPFGTGGDFCKTFGLARDPEEAARSFRSAVPRPIDIGRLEYAAGGLGGPRTSRYFINIASFGIGGLVDRLVNSSSKALGGGVSFFVGLLRATARYRNQRVRLVFDADETNAVEVTVKNVAVANGRYFGGGMQVAPTAQPDDGLFDVVTLGDFSQLDAIRYMYRLRRGTHLSHPKVGHRRAVRVDAAPLDPGDEVLLDVDGEAPGALPATFTLIPKALNLMLPSRGVPA